MIDDLLAQLSFAPSVVRPLAQVPTRIVIGGMGGSGYAGEALSYLVPERDIVVHRDYGLPKHAREDALYIAVSYSGTTEETLSFANAAHEAGYRLAVVATGGKLAEFAEREGITAALVPDGLQPRYALIYMLHALLAVLGERTASDALSAVALTRSEIEEAAQDLAHFVLPSVPLFYASRANCVLAALGKIMMNETARTPAFWNVFSELNHNEMQAFDTDMPEGLEHLFRFVLIRDEQDGSRIKRRMEVFAGLMRERGRMVEEIDISGIGRAQALVALWMRYVLATQSLAETRGIDTSIVPLIEAFKKQL